MGLTVLDAGVVIGALDAHDGHHHAAVAALRACVERHDALVLPVSVYAETLVGPYRRGHESVEALDAFIAGLGIRVAPLTATIAHEAARLRAISGSRLRLPDALVVATAHELDAAVLTTDGRWPGDLGDRVTVLGSAPGAATQR